MTTGFNQIKGELHSLKEEVGSLKEDVGSLKEDVIIRWNRSSCG